MNIIERILFIIYSAMPEKPLSWPENLSANESADNQPQNLPLQANMPDSFARLFNMKFTQADLPSAQKAAENLTALANTLPDEWLAQFGDLLSNLDTPSKQTMLRVFSEVTAEELSSYVETNGYPYNQFSLTLFWKYFWIETNFQALQEREKNAIDNLDKANIERLMEIYHAIADQADGSPVFSLLEQLSEWNPQAYIELKKLLLAEPEQLQKLLEAAKASDRKNQTHHYEALRHTLITIDQRFLGIIEELDNTNSDHQPLSLNQAYLYSLSGDNPQQHGSLIKSTNSHGDKISIDTSTRPPMRELSLAGSAYALETTPFTGALHKPEAKFIKQRNTLNQQLQAINALQNPLIQGHVADLIDHWFNLPEIKHQLKTTYRIDISAIDSLEALRSPAILEAQQREIEADLKDINNAYTEAMRQAINQHKEEVFEQDEKTREILQFVSDIGFDLIPKKYTDQLVAEVKSWLITINAFSLAPARLDLANGKFWESPTEEWGTQWKRNLLMFYNSMISGESDSPLSIEAHLWTSGKREDKTGMRYMLLSNWILTDSGGFNIDTVRENLSHITLST